MGAPISGQKFFRTPLPKKGGQNSRGEAFLFRVTVLLTVLDRRKTYRQAAVTETEKDGFVMRWIKLEHSKSQVQRAGKTLITYPENSNEYNDAVAIINNWRAAHAFPLNTVKILLVKKAAEIEPEATVVQRLKRLESIKGKLLLAKDRGSSTNLARMQDIGGCRVIFDELDSVYTLVSCLERLNPKRFTHKLVGKDDYIISPKTSGYRGIHLVYQFNSSRKREYNGLKIEIQIRTYLQHLWATSVEATAVITKTSLKSSIGPEEWLRFFALMSSIFAIIENRPTVPNTPEDFRTLTEEVRVLNDKMRIYDQLKAYQTFVSSVENKGIDRADYYLLIIDYVHSTLNIVLYEKDDLQIATNRYDELEQSRNHEETDVVLIAASSLDSIKKAYPNYFNNIDGFVRLLARVLRREDGEDLLRLEVDQLYKQLEMTL